MCRLIVVVLEFVYVYMNCCATEPPHITHETLEFMVYKDAF